MKLIDIRGKMNAVNMMHRVVDQWGARNNKSDQAATLRSQTTAFQRSSSSGRAGAEQHEAPAVGQTRIDLYFSVNSRDAAGARQRDGSRATAGPSRPPCTSLLIPGTRPVGRPAHCPDEDAVERPGLYFSVNSRATPPARQLSERVCTSLQMPADVEDSNPDRPCKNLQIVADARPAAIGQSSTHVSLLHEIAAAA
jgi:hypothetical protein